MCSNRTINIPTKMCLWAVQWTFKDWTYSNWQWWVDERMNTAFWWSLTPFCFDCWWLSSSFCVNFSMKWRRFCHSHSINANLYHNFSSWQFQSMSVVLFLNIRQMTRSWCKHETNDAKVCQMQELKQTSIEWCKQLWETKMAWFVDQNQQTFP